MPTLDIGGLIAVIFVCSIAVMLTIALFRYKTVEDVLKLWGGLGSIATAIATYYFTSGVAEKRVQSAEREKDAAVQKLAAAERRYDQVADSRVMWGSLNEPGGTKSFWYTHLATPPPLNDITAPKAPKSTPAPAPADSTPASPAPQPK